MNKKCIFEHNRKVKQSTLSKSLYKTLYKVNFVSKIVLYTFSQLPFISLFWYYIKMHCSSLFLSLLLLFLPPPFPLLSLKGAPLRQAMGLANISICQKGSMFVERQVGYSALFIWLGGTSVLLAYPQVTSFWPSQPAL